MNTHTRSNLTQLVFGLGLMAILAIPARAQMQTLKLIADDYTAVDFFGFRVAVSDDLGLVTATGDDDNGDFSGSAYVFDIKSGQQLRKLLPDDGGELNNFGLAAAINGNLAIIASHSNEVGAAYVFDMTTGEQRFKLQPDDGADGKEFGIDVAMDGNLALVGAAADSVNATFSGSAYLFDLTTGQQLAKLVPADGAAEDLFGISVSLSGNRLLVGASGKNNRVGAAYVFDATTGQQLAKLVPNDGAADDDFGFKVAIHGNTAVVGSPGDDDYGSSSGSAYVFDATTGQQLYKLLPGDGEPGDSFGIAMALSGNTALIGARRSDDAGPQSGSAYLFDVSTGQQLAKLLAEDAGAGDQFGHSVAINGRTALISAWFDTHGAANAAGSAYVLELPEFKSETRKLVAEDYSQDAFFGGSVGLAGNTALIGASGDGENGAFSGAAYLFDVHSGQQLRKLLPEDGEVEDYFGAAVAIRGDLALVTAPGDDDKGEFSGSAYLFDAKSGQQLFKLTPNDGMAGGNFGLAGAMDGNRAVITAQRLGVGSAYIFDVSTGQQRFKLQPQDGAATKEFGISAAMSGNVVLVGAPLDDENGHFSGSAYLFDATTGEQLAKLLPEDGAAEDFFGLHVAVDGNTAIVGASNHDGEAGENSGAAYLFDVTTGEQIAKLQPQDAEQYATFGEGVAIQGNTIVIGATSNGSASSSHYASAYVFDLSTRQQLAKLVHSDREQNDGFGLAIALDDNTALLGAFWNTHSGVEAPGSAYAFAHLRPLPPTIVSQPQGQSLNEGDHAKFGVVVEGTAPFHFRWLLDGVEIIGATNADLVLTGVQKHDAGSYSVLVSNEFGSVTSDPAVLAVNLHPLADAGATRQLWTSANGIDANVVLDGSRSSDPDGDPLTHVWKLDSTAIAAGIVAVATLPLGEHVVELVVDDGMAQSTDGITVSVLTASQSVERLEMLVANSGLSDKQQMLSSLNAALASIDRGNRIAAINQLHAFQNKLRAQVSPGDPRLAAELTQVSTRVIDALGGDSSLRGAAKIWSLKRSSNAAVQLQIEAAVGYVHLVEASTDMAEWTPVGTASLGADGSIQFEDAAAGTHDRRFYRIVSP